MQTITLSDIELRLIANALTQTLHPVTGVSNMVSEEDQGYFDVLMKTIINAQSTK